MPHAEEIPPTALPAGKYFVNDGPLEPANTAPLRPTTLDTPIDEIRQRFQSDGYLFLKGLLPRQDVL